MNEVLRDKWVAALRSGKYEQSRGRLRTQNGYCCLGVLCDVKDPNGWNQENDRWIHKDSFREGSWYLSESLREEVGLTEECQVRLAKLNDDGETFERIAQEIEKNGQSD